jgi:hypothetical protein
MKKKNSSCNFFLLQFLIIITLDPDPIEIQPKILNPDPYQMNTDTKHWVTLFRYVRYGQFMVLYSNTSSSAALKITQGRRRQGLGTGLLPSVELTVRAALVQKEIASKRQLLEIVFVYSLGTVSMVKN